MPEYVMGENEDRGEVARRLLDQAGDRAAEVTWLPRADTPGGGVFVVPDDVADNVGRAATTEQGTAKGEYPYDGSQEGDPERREADRAALEQDPNEAEGDEDAENADAVEPAAEAAPPQRRRRATAATISTTDQQ